MNAKEGRKVILHETDLDGFLKDDDKAKIEHVRKLYEKSLDACARIESEDTAQNKAKAEDDLVKSSAEIGAYLYRRHHCVILLQSTERIRTEKPL